MVGKTVLCVSHKMSDAKAIDNSLVMVKGRLVERGTHDELMANPESTYASMWASEDVDLKETRLKVLSDLHSVRSTSGNFEPKLHLRDNDDDDDDAKNNTNTVDGTDMESKEGQELHHHSHDISSWGLSSSYSKHRGNHCPHSEARGDSQT